MDTKERNMDECTYCGNLMILCTCTPDRCIECGDPLTDEDTSEDWRCNACEDAHTDARYAAAWDSLTWEQQDRVVLRGMGF